MLGKDAREERESLRPFGQKVICYDYEVINKLSPRSYEARMIGHTSSFGTYWVRTQEGATKLAKNPIPIPDERESESEDELPGIENVKILSRPISPEYQPDLPSRPSTPETSPTPTPAKAPDPKKKRIMSQCIGDEGAYTNKDHNLIIRTHVDDLLGIAPTEADLDIAEKGAEQQGHMGKCALCRMLHGRYHGRWKTRTISIDSRGATLQGQMGKCALCRMLHGRYHGRWKTRTISIVGGLLYRGTWENALSAECYMGDIMVGGKPEQYQSIVGGLPFIARMTRPEISIHVNLLGRRATDASPVNWTTALGVLGYLHLTRQEGIILRKAKGLHLRIYVDISYGGEGARSQTGVLLTLGKQAIGWYSRRQDVVSLSITEAEYIADCKGAKDADWSQQLLG